MKKVSFLLILIPIMLLTTACSGVTSGLNGIFGGDGSIIFGNGTFEDGVTNEKSTFVPGEDFLIETYLNEPFGTSEIEFITVKSGADDTEEIYSQWNETVDPAWDSLIYEYHVAELDGEFEPGDYILRIYSGDSELISEGTFTIE